MSKLLSVEIKQDDFHLPTPEVLQEQNLAIYDLLQDNFFELIGFESIEEIRLNISLDYGSLVFEVCSKESKSLRTFLLSLTPLRQIINDYHTICQSYFSAVKKLPIDKIEAIDMGRKGIHNEGARVLIQRLEGKINLNLETSRRIFTLIYALTYER
jgi:uncharacterized protein (UPF0262 family)